MIREKKIKVWVTLLDEGTDTIRQTEALEMGDGLYKLLPTPWYDSEDETWEFLPESIVRLEKSKDFHGNEVLLACKQ